MNSEELYALLPIIAIVGGLSIAGFGMWQRARMRELASRERIAMIERGLVPPADMDPETFERARGRYLSDEYRHYRPNRFRSAGVILMGIGLGLTVLITFAAGQPSVGLGVGGSFALVGLAFFLLSVLEAREAPRRTSTRAGGTPPSADGPSSDAV